LGDAYDADEFEKVYDIVDIWFESGATHSFVLNDNQLPWPADLYLEGSDQHRGWFQSSLLESCGTREAAPFKRVLTHGFVLDEHGKKMSKSQGNVVSPQSVISQYGADILRLWVMNSSYTDDLRIGPELLKQQADLYRKIRNTFKWLLGALKDWDHSETVDVMQMRSIDKWMLHRLYEISEMVQKATKVCDWQGVTAALHNFCVSDLSAFYFDVVKDTLYCDSVDNNRRRSARTVLDLVFHCLTRWFAPVLVFTMEEIWRSRFPDRDSIHLMEFVSVPESYKDGALASQWEAIKLIRDAVMEKLEEARSSGLIGSSLQARLEMTMPETLMPMLTLHEWKEILIVSEVDILSAYGIDTNIGQFPGNLKDKIRQFEVRVFKADGEKCERCWNVLPHVDYNHKVYGERVCIRCLDVIQKK
jgi:isoleucyl-tRNA synthetase